MLNDEPRHRLRLDSQVIHNALQEPLLSQLRHIHL